MDMMRSVRDFADEALREARRRKRAYQSAVNRLTNWQRNQWARAGYPGLRQADADKVLPFTELTCR